jgi:hypothetical protein
MLPPARSAKAKTKATMKAAKVKRIWAKASKSAGLPTAAKVVAEQAGVAPVGAGTRGAIEPRSARVFVRPAATTKSRRK